MELIEKILSKDNLNDAFEKVVANNGASGIDGIEVGDLKEYIKKHKEEILTRIRTKQYFPQPLRRVYIPKANGSKRPLGIPTTIDRVIQQAIAAQFSEIYEDILREQVNDSTTLNLIRKYLKAGVMENKVFSKTDEGVPQGGPLSVILANIYLDKLDKELESRELRFVRYADDVIIFVKSEKAADRVLKSISSWIERKLFLKVNATKSKVVRPTKSKYLGFTFIKYNGKWEVRPLPEKTAKFKKRYANI